MSQFFEYHPAQGVAKGNIVFVPGMGCGAHFFRFSVPYFKNYNLYLFNNPGLGAVPSSVSFRSLSHMAQHIADSPELKKVERYHVVGHSMGVATALELAKHDNRVEKLALFNGSPGGWCRLPEIMRVPLKILRHRYPLTRSGFLRLMFAPDYIRDNPQAFEDVLVRHYEGTKGLSAHFNHARLYFKWRLTQSIAKAIPPENVFIFHGLQDIYIPLSSSRRLAHLLGTKNHHIFEHHGHVPFLEKMSVYEEVLAVFEAEH